MEGEVPILLLQTAAAADEVRVAGDGREGVFGLVADSPGKGGGGN